MEKIFFKHNEFDLTEYLDGFNVVDISDLNGIFAMCSYENIEILKMRAEKFSFPMISIFGSGNFHYLTYAVLKNLNKKSAVIVFDHHDDFENFEYPNFTSCGSWIFDLIENNQFVTQVLVLGSDVENKNLKTFEDSKLKVLKEKDLSFEKLKSTLSCVNTENIYLSIDRDILSENELKTDWDQGNISVHFLCECISYIASNFKIIGADICGDLDFHSENSPEFKNSISVYKKIISAIEKSADIATG